LAAELTGWKIKVIEKQKELQEKAMADIDISFNALMQKAFSGKL
jgi:hypothetical protein